MPGFLSLAPSVDRLALRWIHELVPDIAVDMRDARVPVDLLVYRVTSRLGIIDPRVDTYAGSGSQADLAIQAFARRCFPQNPTLADADYGTVILPARLTYL
jgi:hypothetical protein